MSFSIVFKKNNSPKNKIGKSTTTVATITGTLRNETDIINPVILFEYSSVLDANYMTIDIFRRSYFITNLRSIRNNLWEVTGHVDVLDSFQNEIKTNTVIVGKQQNLWDLYLDDGTFKADVNPLIVIKSFPVSNRLSTFHYILTVAG